MTASIQREFNRQICYPSAGGAKLPNFVGNRQHIKGDIGEIFDRYAPVMGKNL